MRLCLALCLVTICLTPFSAAASRAAEPGATLEVGAPFPEIPLPDLAGRTPTGLSAYRGRKVYLMIFASW